MTIPLVHLNCSPLKHRHLAQKTHWYQRSEMQKTEDRASIRELFGHAGAPGRPDQLNYPRCRRPGRKSFTFSACSSSFHSSRQEVVIWIGGSLFAHLQNSCPQLFEVLF